VHVGEEEEERSRVTNCFHPKLGVPLYLSLARGLDDECLTEDVGPSPPSDVEDDDEGQKGPIRALRSRRDDNDDDDGDVAVQSFRYVAVRLLSRIVALRGREAPGGDAAGTRGTRRHRAGRGAPLRRLQLQHTSS